MKNFLKLFFSLFIVLSFVLTQQSAFAYRTEPQPPHWHSLFLIVYMPKDNEYSAKMESAFNEWQSVLGKSIEFYFTDDAGDKAPATIDISFRKVEGEDVKNSVAASVNKDSVLIKSSKIVVNAKYDPKFENDKEAKDSNDKELYELMRHACGVALGLPDSTNENSIMFPERKDNQSITPEEKEYLRKIFVLPKGPEQK